MLDPAGRMPLEPRVTERISSCRRRWPFASALHCRHLTVVSGLQALLGIRGPKLSEFSGHHVTQIAAHETRLMIANQRVEPAADGKRFALEAHQEIQCLACLRAAGPVSYTHL